MTKNRIINIFQDNIQSDIMPSDMRVFVNAIFDAKENNIRKITDTSKFTTVSFPTYPIRENDLVIINEENNANKMNGLYLSTKSYPSISDLTLISPDIELNELLSSGQDNEILSIVDGELIWIPQQHGYYIKGTKIINEILSIIPLNIGEIFIAEESDPYAAVPGLQGDGYSWSGSEWINIGALSNSSIVAAGIKVDTYHFDNIFDEEVDTVQKALNIIDDFVPDPAEIPLDTSSFTGNLSSFDTTIQAAFETIDNYEVDMSTIVTSVSESQPGAVRIESMVRITQADYDLLTTKYPTTFYVIVG